MAAALWVTIGGKCPLNDFEHVNVMEMYDNSTNTLNNNNIHLPLIVTDNAAASCDTTWLTSRPRLVEFQFKNTIVSCIVLVLYY